MQGKPLQKKLERVCNIMENEKGKMGILEWMLKEAKKQKINIRLYLRNGYQMVGIIEDYDEQCVVLGNCSGLKYVLIDAISTVERAG